MKKPIVYFIILACLFSVNHVEGRSRSTSSSSSSNVQVSGGSYTSVKVNSNGKKMSIETNAREVQVRGTEYTVKDPRTERVFTCKNCAYQNGDPMRKCPRCKGKAFICECK